MHTNKHQKVPKVLTFFQQELQAVTFDISH
jgi:hypothetical protein